MNVARASEMVEMLRNIPFVVRQGSGWGEVGWGSVRLVEWDRAV